MIGIYNVKALVGFDLMTLRLVVYLFRYEVRHNTEVSHATLNALKLSANISIQTA